MSNNINTFAENMRQTITNQTNTISLLSSMLKAISTSDQYVQYDYVDLNGDLQTYQLPSYNAIIDRLSSVEESMNSLINGYGSINLQDGSRRQIKLTNVPNMPAQITGVPDPSVFHLDTNWFFEDLMFPGVTVRIDLTGQIEDDADRVQVKRIILDSNDLAATDLWSSNLSSNIYDYPSLLSLLSYNGVSYSEDTEIIELPLTTNNLVGDFQVIDDPVIINGKTWYHVNTLSYRTVTADGINAGVNNILSIGDMLQYSNSIYRVVEVDQNSNKIRIIRVNGVAIPGVYTVFKYYQDPFREKTINVRFGAHEYNIIYVKGIAEQFNLVGNEWSNPIRFASDDLVFADNTNVSLATYYATNVVDWGAQMIAEAKERRLNAYNGHTPNAPTLSINDFRVVQINTLINASIDTNDVKNTVSEIESTKSQISSLKATIAAQKTDLQNITSLDEYRSMQQQISTNTTDLQNLQSSYSTLVEYLHNMVRDNESVMTTPKYHIRGFFPIPELKYRDETQTMTEEIIGFEIAYRYIKQDNTGVQLDTYTFTDKDGQSSVTGTFCDWTIEKSRIKQRTYNMTTNMYEWNSENVADGSEININQIDIPITKGEKVEIKVRSISEAGYPDNPLISPWSNAVIVEFPSSLSTRNEIADLIESVNDDALNLAINNILDSLGVLSHLDDSIQNTNSVNGLYFKHIADSIAYEDKTDDGIQSVSLLDKISNLEERLAMLEKNFNYLMNKYDWDIIY